MPTCSVCGKEMQKTSVDVFKCPNPGSHASGEPRIGSALLECPLKEGAIWVRVVDSKGNHVNDAPIIVTGPKGGDQKTNAGFASFDPMPAEDGYSVEFKIPKGREDEFYKPAKTKYTNIAVHRGEITSATFTLELVAPLKVFVDHPENFPGELQITVTPPSEHFKPPSEPTKALGLFTFPRLRKESYSVGFALTEVQKKKFAIVGKTSDSWSHDPHKTDNEVKFKVVAVKLVSLTVEGADSLGVADKYWTVADGKKVKVIAHTEPPDAEARSHVTWSTGETGKEILVDADAVKDLKVKATLDVEKSVDIEIYDLVDIECADLHKISDRKWKCYESNDKKAKLTAKTNPDEEKVWKLLKWDKGTPDSTSHECDVEVKSESEPEVEVKLGSKTLKATLKICRWPLLEIKQVTFDCHDIINDGQVEMGKVFSKEWHSTGKADHSFGRDTAKCQSPVCYTMETKVKLSAVFTVTRKPSEEETVKVQAKLGFSTITADIQVKPTDSEVTMPMIESAGILPKQVDYNPAWKIDWESTLEDGSWADAKSSTHVLYVLFRDPRAKAYFTLVHISCEGAIGKSNENDVAMYSFAPLKASTDDGNGIRRKGDGTRLTYYRQGVKTNATTAYTTTGILSAPDATGRCGGWAELLIHMWKIHGIRTGRKRWFIRALLTEHADMDQRFLVKNLNFPAIQHNPFDLYKYDGSAAIKVDGVPGQGKKNPQFDFGDHVIITHNGRYYDPSYGIDGYTSDAAYIADAIGGLGFSGNSIDFDMADNTPQFISEKCVPYGDGCIEYTIHDGLSMAALAGYIGITEDQLLNYNPSVKAYRPTPAHVQPGDELDTPDSFRQYTVGAPYTFSDIAAICGVTEDKLLDLDPALKALCGNPAGVLNGDVVLFPTTPNQTYTIKRPVTLAMIAAEHGLTEQEIFDHIDNFNLKLVCGVIGNLQHGDKVVVSSDMLAGGVWIHGHDI